MESLALLVTGILAIMLTLGPLGILAVKYNYVFLGVLCGAASLFLGLWYLVGVPSAPPLMGLWAAGAGAYALYSGARAYR
jgi:hypothetical protein